MNRTQIYLTDKEHKFIKKEAYEKGISMSEVIRNFIDNDIEDRCRSGVQIDDRK
jgi:hypothetical protein